MDSLHAPIPLRNVSDLQTLGCQMGLRRLPSSWVLAPASRHASFPTNRSSWSRPGGAKSPDREQCRHWLSPIRMRISPPVNETRNRRYPACSDRKILYFRRRRRGFEAARSMGRRSSKTLLALPSHSPVATDGHPKKKASPQPAGCSIMRQSRLPASLRC